MIMACDCQHESQDNIHGKGKRVHNLCKKGIYCRCTVCGKEKISGLKAKEVKENRK